MTLDATSFDAALKLYYTPDKVQDLTYKSRPFLAMVPKNTEFYGKKMPVPVYWGNPTGRSATFSRAQTRGALTSSSIGEFDVTRVHDYGYIVIDAETMEASENDKGAFMKARTTEIDGILNSLSNSLANACWGTGWGNIGQVASTVTTAKVITLLNSSDIVNFEVGQELVAAADVGTSAIRAIAGTNGAIITKIDRSAGTITCGAENLSTTFTGGVIANDYLFVRGDRLETAPSGVGQMKISGIAAWIPTVAPTTGDSFFSLDRSKDATRLGGLRFDRTGYPIEEALIDGAVLADREGAEFDYYFISPKTMGSLIKALGAKVNYVEMQVTPKISFRGLDIIGPKNNIRVMADRFVPDNLAYGITLDSWELASLKDTVRILNSDGLEMLRKSDSDSYEVRVGYYANLVCRAPGHNAVITLA